MFGVQPVINLSAFQRGVNDLIWSIAPPAASTVEAGEAAGSDELQLPVITTDADLDKFLLDYFSIRLPNVQCCKNHRTPWEAFHDAYFARSIISVWKASRGFGGKSFLLALLALTEAVTLRADVNILGGSGIQSKRILETMVKLWKIPTAPRKALKSDPGGQKQTFIWENTVTALMASQASVRGPHPQRLRMDEVDEMDLEILDAALPQPMSKGWVQSHVVLSSTHQYADGTMTEILKRAGANGWPFFEWCYRESMEPHGWLSAAEVARKRAILTVKMWDTEIEGQEPSSEGRAIETESVQAAFKPHLKLEAPDAAGKYATGSDWAKKKNHTVVVTIRKDVRPMRVVAIKRVQKEPWPKMAGYLNERIGVYGGTSVHDNTGIGQVVADLLDHESEDFNMVGRQRADLLSEYVAAIEKGDLLWPKDDDDPALAAAYSEHLYATRDDVYKGSKDGTGSHHLPDTFSAGALAWRAATVTEARGTSTPPPNTSDTQNLNKLAAVTARMRAGRTGNDSQVVDAPEPEKKPEAPAITRTRWKRDGQNPGDGESNDTNNG